MNLFRYGNTYDKTECYTKKEIDELNAEWKSIVDEHGLVEGSDMYGLTAKNFCDAVAQR